LQKQAKRREFGVGSTGFGGIQGGEGLRRREEKLSGYKKRVRSSEINQGGKIGVQISEIKKAGLIANPCRRRGRSPRP